MTEHIKHDWYQSETHIVVDIMVKDVKKEDLFVKCLDDSLTVKFTTADGEAHTFQAHLEHEVNPESCVHLVYPSKIEVKMAKRSDVRWTQLERPVEARLDPLPVLGGDGPQRYPSSCPAAKDWDRLEAEISREEKEGEGEELDSLFQNIYSQGSDEVKKAMNKSFSESGGTVLSTNWGEVERDKITVKAPDGMEFKQWDS